MRFVVTYSGSERYGGPVVRCCWASWCQVCWPEMFREGHVLSGDVEASLISQKIAL